MKPASPIDMKRAVDILCSAFDENRGINWLVKSDEKRKLRIRRVMEYTFDKCLAQNGAFLSDDGNGVILAEKPGEEKTSFSGIVTLISLIVKAIGLSRIAKVAKKDAYIKSKYPDTSFYSLIFIAVDPKMHGRGIGNSLLNEFLIKARSEELPVYLETSNEKNIHFYEKRGFRIYDTWQNPSGRFPVWMLRTET